VDRLVFGTSTVEDPRLLAKLLERYDPERVAAAIDLRDGRLGVRGWAESSDRTPEEVLASLEELGIRWVVCTEIVRDGAMAGPGLDLVRRLVSARFRVVAAGGVTTARDITVLREIGAAGCIIGRALYEGGLALEVALEAADAG
jgi:phosphoribosylformimino-5-aminoimidazole carboxamide ribotide isomerase